MMKRNKITGKMLAGVLAVGLIASAAVPAYAAEEENPNQKEMEVGYTEGSTFTLNIPATLVALKEGEEVSEKVGLTSINVGTTEKVQIKVTKGISGGKVTLVDEKDPANTCKSLVALTSGAETGIGDNEVVAEFEGTSTNPTKGGTLYFSQLGDVPAGTYRGTIEFTASLVNK